MFLGAFAFGGVRATSKEKLNEEREEGWGIEGAQDSWGFPARRVCPSRRDFEPYIGQRTSRMVGCQKKKKELRLFFFGACFGNLAC